MSSNLSVSKLAEYKKLIENFNKENGGNVSANNSSKILSNIKKRKNKIEKIALDEKINDLMKKLWEARKKWDKKSIAILEAELTAKKISLAWIAKSESNLRWLEKLTSKIDIDKFNSSEIEQKIIDLRKLDKELDVELKKEEEIQKKLDSGIRKYQQEIKAEVDKKDKSEKTAKENPKKTEGSQEIDDRKSYNILRTETGEIKAYTWINWNKQTFIFTSELTISEIQIIKNNPENIKKLIDFKSFLDNRGLWFLWNYRYKLKLDLAKWNNFYNYEDWLSVQEQLDLLNFIWEKLGFKYSEDINNLKEQFETKSRLSVFEANWKKYENNSSKSSFEQALEWKLIDKWTWIEKPKKH